MKINEPVTNNEVKMKEGTILVSKTDLKGSITYCNHEFMEISGFSYDELIGKNHNVVRHPDMPPQAFKSLWDDVKDKKSWTAPVKNRAKNGDYYWVNANVTPIYEGGEIVEYMSVRTRPTDEEISAASQLYNDINNGKGSLEKTGLAAVLEKVSSISSVNLQYLGVVIFSAVMLTMGGLLNSGADVSSISQIMMSLAVVFLVVGVVLVKKISKPMHYLHEKITEVSRGNYFSWTDISRNDDIGEVLKSLFALQVRLGFDVMDAREKAVSGQIVQSALDNASSNMMLVDQEHKIIYLNETIKTLFKDAQSDISSQVSNFNVNKLVGSSLLDLYKDPAKQKGIIESLTKSHKAEKVYGNTILKILSSPIIQDGKRIGTVLEWENLTQERNLESEIEHLVVAAQSGDLSNRLDASNKVGFFKNLSVNLNEMFDVLEGTFADVNMIMSQVAEGNLGQTIDRAYDGVFGEVKNNVNETIHKLRDIVDGIRESSNLINNSSQEIASGNINLSNRTEQQAGSLEEISSSMEEITSTVKQNADNASQANQLASDAGDTADQGGHVVAKAIDAMEEINKSSTKIAEIIGVIDEIAFQTNLLALNASVEAARAGEQGRGFAVVATEVRNLAQRSATAAKEIKDLIQDSVNKVKAGSDLVNESGETLGEIVLGVKKVRDIVGEIAAASSEQSTGVEQVSTSLTSLDDLTQQNAALAEQASAASTHMSEQSNTMNQQMMFFKTDIIKAKAESTLDFKLAKSKHLSWKDRLRNFLDDKEELTAEQAVSHRHCDLGKWLYADGLRVYGEHQELIDMEKTHKEMHGHISAIIDAKEAGDLVTSEDLYKKVSSCSDQVVDNLTTIEKKVKG